MKHLRVEPLAYESFGVRSMCTYVETPDVKILIDGGVALGPRLRFLPHPLEYDALSKCRMRIREAAAKVDVVTVSHYHNDHHTPNFTDTIWLGSSPSEAEAIYSNKLLLMKDIRLNINLSQRRRGWMFQRFAKKVGAKCEVADNRTFQFGETILRFSQPVVHGEENSNLGWVLMLTLERNGEKLLYAPDVQGPVSDRTLGLMLQEKAQLVIVGGPPLYLQDYLVSKSTINKGLANLEHLVSTTPTTIIEHHLLRSKDWNEALKPVLKASREAGYEVLTAAGFAKAPERLLESIREELYEREPPSEEFIKWSRLSREKRKNVPPPVQ